MSRCQLTDLLGQFRTAGVPTDVLDQRVGEHHIEASVDVRLRQGIPDLGQISAQARSRFAQVIVIVIDGGEEFARWWIELCCAPVELKSRLVEARVKSRSPSGVLAAFSAPFSAQVPPTFGAKMQVNDLGADRNVERDPSQVQCERPGNAQITTSPGVDNN